MAADGASGAYISTSEQRLCCNLRVRPFRGPVRPASKNFQHALTVEQVWALTSRPCKYVFCEFGLAATTNVAASAVNYCDFKIAAANGTASSVRLKRWMSRAFFS